MALQPCKSCKQQVDDSAKLCPHCGIAHPGVKGIEVIAGILVVGVIIAISVSMCSDGESKKPVEQKVPAEVVINSDSGLSRLPEKTMPESLLSEVSSLEIEPGEYVEQLNDVFKKIKLKYRVSTKGVVIGDVNDVLKVPIGKHSFLIARLSKVDGKIIDIVIVGGGDGSPSSGLDIMMIASAALAAAAPAVEFDEVFRELPTLLKGTERIYGDVKISAKVMDDLGTWFFAESVEKSGL